MVAHAQQARRCHPGRIAVVIALLLLLFLVLGQLRPRTDASAPLFPYVDIPYHKTSSTPDGFPGSAADDQSAAPHDLTMSSVELLGGLLVEFKRRELVSLSSKTGAYLHIDFTGRTAYNPNLIPHPTDADVYVVVAQKTGQNGDQVELICDASIQNDTLACSEYPSVLPVAPSIKGQCPGQFSALNDFPGPRDARVAYSPKVPYIVYGSQSHYACLGLWTQDLRQLTGSFDGMDQGGTVWYQEATELWRPEPYDVLQKNFFMFWDSTNNTYVQSDAYPKRTLARLDAQGHVVEDLSSAVEAHDTVCMDKYMPVPKKTESAIDHESIHQSTNSLSITLCKRSDPDCSPDESNTFVMHIIHYKLTYAFHTVYEPYLVLFQQDAPFGLHAIAERAFWVRGRQPPQTEGRKYGNTNHDIPAGQSEMVYVTSMSWKNQNQTYHGYIDDPVFLALGIEDTTAGVIDVLADDLVQDLGYC